MAPKNLTKLFGAVLVKYISIHPVYVGTAGGAAEGVSLPRNNWK